ncbi:TPA: type I secretion system protein LssZ, partial [Legionella pneumophila]|nr:type I secretion system protein LssZ [Legionella pneumophila]
MHILAKVIHCIFPLIALTLLIIGIKRNAIYYIISSLWISLISLVIHYQTSGGEILGTYFNYLNATIYTINLLVLCLSLVCVLWHLSNDNVAFKIVSSLFQSFIVIGALLVVI